MAILYFILRISRKCIYRIRIYCHRNRNCSHLCSDQRTPDHSSCRSHSNLWHKYAYSCPDSKCLPHCSGDSPCSSCQHPTHCNHRNQCSSKDQCKRQNQCRSCIWSGWQNTASGMSHWCRHRNRHRQCRIFHSSCYRTGDWSRHFRTVPGQSGSWSYTHH